MRFSTILTIASAATLVLSNTDATAQLADLQFGRNFSQSAQFGTGRSENLDIGDVDNDGDLDVIVGNGGDGTNQANRIYINQGGLQGGTLGTFLDETGPRFAGLPPDRTRDVEFADIDKDGDLDIYVANRGSTAEGGQVSRFHINQGGLQGGTIGFYQEDTNNRWGTLTSVPLAKQIFGGNSGPWRDFTCDCDFADLDDDGDLDLFHSSYGPGFNGTENSRIFLNDGAGFFNEISPWINPGGDISSFTLDMDIMDFDGDFDLDIVMSSRDNQARVFMNNTYEGISGSFFQDITQHALLNQGATLSGTNNYECEPVDADGDGDFDVWMKNYNGNADRLMRNNGFTPGAGFYFSQMNGWIKGDPVVDENELDFIDYDSDGDLDAFAANFSGTNWLYQSSLAQGLPFSQGIYHRTGTGLAPSPELPTTGNGGTTLDGEVGDMDNDGDQDLMLANDGNQQNRYFENELGVPDTHAPTFIGVTVQGDKAGGTDTVIHATIDDNIAFYMTAYYNVDLVYTVNAGSPTTVDMFSQGGQMFRGVIPDSSGVVSYHIEATDRAGNTGVSGTTVFTQGPPPASAWMDIGFGLAGVSGIPTLTGTGTMVIGTPNSVNLTNAAPSALAVLFVSLSSTPSPFKGGTLAPVPVLLDVTLGTSGAGEIPISVPSWPGGLPPTSTVFCQYAIVDATGPAGVSLSNAIKGTQP
ncbi:MAG: FG-GAP repeat domain-containing protein [Planctomycetota bacterium]|jgi:hypothetical protein